MTSIHCVGVSFAYNDAVPLLADLNLHIVPGWIGVVGPNGIGKTTLLRLIAGELTPDRGQIGAAWSAEPSALLLDEPTNHLDETARHLLLTALDGFRGIGLVRTAESHAP